MTPRVGCFVLHEPIGRGGMGDVWSATHEDTGVAAAVKVLSSPRTRDSAFVNGFRREVRAVAGLDHPNVIVVFDAGTVVGAGGVAGLAEGTPWLAMERCEGGTLSNRRGRLAWPALRTVLLALLEALAHAHARGVIHRDLKPANVLVGSGTDLATALRLTDFGIARLADPAGSRRESAASSAGTPRYMAPEQFLADARGQGPWTDLYALGCLGWSLCCGEAPFRGSDFRLLARAHIHDAPGAFRPRHEVPAGLETWLRGLLGKSPLERFRRAADAAWALRQLNAPEVSAATLSAGQVSPGAVTWVSVASEAPTARIDRDQQPPRVGSVPELRVDPPPFPRDWRRERWAPRAMPLIGSGLGLFGLRQVPAVGRDAAWDILWAALDAARGSLAQAVLLMGPEGIGRSHLARDVCQRAHEVGAADVWAAFHAEDGGGATGLEVMLRRALDAESVDGDALAAWLAQSLPAHLVSATLEAVRAAGSDSAVAVAALARLLGIVSADRPVVIWLDDVDLSDEALRLAVALLTRPDTSRGRLLVIGTAKDASGLSALTELSRVRTVALAPLDDAARQRLVRGLLGLTGDLAVRVEARSGGHPGFAVQLVRSWITAGVLEASPHGFRLAGPEPRLPADVVQATAAGLAWIQALPARDQQALERAAVLGRHVDRAEWEGALGHPIPAGLVDRMAREGLVRTHPGGFAFAGATPVEALRQRASDGGRLAGHHAACAAVLSESDHPARVGHHRLGAGDPSGALDPLIEAATETRWKHRDYRRALALLASAELASQEAGIDDARVAWIAIQRARCLRAIGRVDAALEIARETLARSQSRGWQRGEAMARQALAEILRDQGQLAAAETHLAAAEGQFEALGDDDSANLCRIERGYIAYHRGDFAAAAERFREGMTHGAPEGLVRWDDAAYGLAMVWANLGQLDEAEALCEEVEAHYRARGNRLGQAGCANVLGGIHARRGHRDAALDAYERAREHYEAIGSTMVALAYLNIAKTWVADGDGASALRPLSRAAELDALKQRPYLEGAVHLLRAAAAGLVGDWPAFDDALDNAERLLGRAETRDVETPAIAVQAAEAAARAGENGRARRAWLFAAGRYERVGGVEAAERARSAAASAADDPSSP